MLLSVLWLVAGLVVLVFGAEFLVKGAASLAARLGIPSIIVGLTVVAFGTSAPEMAVSAFAALSGNTGVAVGNVVGSNIFNVLFILGVSAAIAPLAVARQLVRIDVPIMIAVSGLAWILVVDGSVSFVEAVVFAVGLLLYIGLQIGLARRNRGRLAEDDALGDPVERGALGALKDVGQVAAGLGALVLGSRWLVSGAVEIAAFLGVSDTVVGLTIVAAGTSMPEVATSIMATIRGQRDIAVGNVVGSNIFNLLAVLGIAGVLSPDGLSVSPSLVAFDIPIMMAIAVICLPIFASGRTISRVEGLVLLSWYVAYTTVLVMREIDSAMLAEVERAIVMGLAPATAVALLVTWGLEARRQPAAVGA